MTKEQAIKWLKDMLKCFDLPQEQYQIALEMAIKALEQEPCDHYTEGYFKGYDDGQEGKLEQEPKTGWNNHQIACMLADLFGDACACNYNGIDEWLPEVCDFKDTCCPNPVGVACWEQFLKYSQSRYTECGYEVRDKNALQEPKTDTWSIKEVADALERHGLLEQEPILDKIRAEIEKPLREERFFDTANAKAQAIALRWCIEIIDKYRSES